LNKCQGTDLESSSGSIFFGVKRRSASDGVVAADEDTLTKAMKRAASRNMDGTKKDKPMGETTTLSPLSAMSSANMNPGTPKSRPSSISVVSIPKKDAFQI